MQLCLFLDINCENRDVISLVSSFLNLSFNSDVDCARRPKTVGEFGPESKLEGLED